MINATRKAWHAADRSLSPHTGPSRRDRLRKNVSWCWGEYRNQIIGIGAAVLTLITVLWAIWFFFLATHRQEATVTSVHWRRQMQVVDFQTRHRSGWDYPPDARVTGHEERRSGSHEDCYGTGNSRFCTTVVEYDTWYFYNVDRWETSEWLTTEATNHNPLWAGVESQGFDCTAVIGNRCLGKDRHEFYEVRFEPATDSDEAHYEVSENVLRKIKEGDKVVLSLNHQGWIRSISTPTVG